jgi:hypothetical protein
MENKGQGRKRRISNSTYNRIIHTKKNVYTCKHHFRHTRTILCTPNGASFLIYLNVQCQIQSTRVVLDASQSISWQERALPASKSEKGARQNTTENQYCGACHLTDSIRVVSVQQILHKAAAMTCQSIHDTECRQTTRNRRFTENALRWRKSTHCSTHRYITNWIDMSVVYVYKTMSSLFPFITCVYYYYYYYRYNKNLAQKDSYGFKRTTGHSVNEYLSRLHQSIAGTRVLMNLILRGVWNLSLWIYNILPSHNSFPNFTKNIQTFYILHSRRRISRVNSFG